MAGDEAMKPELQNELFEKYPKIFIQKDLPMSQTCMCWGVETGDGWYDIIDVLCHQIQWYLEYNLPEDEDPEVVNVQAVQVKEKYGTLRFYYNGGNEFISGLVSMAEGMSGRTCENCGAPGNAAARERIRPKRMPMPPAVPAISKMLVPML